MSRMSLTTPRAPSASLLYDDTPSKSRLTYNYSSDFDLGLPNARKKAPEDLWIHPRQKTVKETFKKDTQVPMDGKVIDEIGKNVIVGGKGSETTGSVVEVLSAEIPA